MGQTTALVITYAFPPMGGIAVQRPLKFVRYLRNYGWEPVVLTTRGAYSPTMDDALMSEVPKTVRVERVADPVSKWIGALAGTSGALSSDATSTSPDSLVRAWRLWFKSFLKAGLKAVKKLLFVPDEHTLWALRAAFVGRRMVRKYGIECVYTTSGPHSAHIVGWLLRKWTGVKWVADFRDPWVDNLHYSHTGLRDKVERWMERRVFLRADSVITVTDSFQKMFQVKFPTRADCIHVIRNGIDPSDFPEVTAPSGQGPFTFFYAGILYPKRSPEKFLQALSVVLRYHRIRRKDIRVEFAGVFDYPGKTDNAVLVKQLGLDDVVTVHGYLSHEEVLERMQQADGLLLIGEPGATARHYVPGKLYEYLFARRPVLALLEDGEAAQIVREATAGLVVHPRDVQNIADSIVTLVKSKFLGAPRFAADSEYVKKYSRVEQTRELACLFDKLTRHTARTLESVQFTEHV